MLDPHFNQHDTELYRLIDCLPRRRAGEHV